MLPILSTSALILLGLLPLQDKNKLGALAQGDAARPTFPQNAVPSRITAGHRSSKIKPTKDSSVEFVAPGYYGIYSDQKCREIYAACDIDGDDKIQYFEALGTLDSVSSRKDSAGWTRTTTVSCVSANSICTSSRFVSLVPTSSSNPRP